LKEDVLPVHVEHVRTQRHLGRTQHVFLRSVVHFKHDRMLSDLSIEFVGLVEEQNEGALIDVMSCGYVSRQICRLPGRTGHHSWQIGMVRGGIGRSVMTLDSSLRFALAIFAFSAQSATGRASSRAFFNVERHHFAKVDFGCNVFRRFGGAGYIRYEEFYQIEIF
jgi:hypothetical protein